MKNVYIECSMLAANPTVNTGIQRVVRHILKEVQALSDELGVKVSPVDLTGGAWRLVEADALLFRAQSKSVRITYLAVFKDKLKRVLRSLEGYPRVIRCLYFAARGMKKLYWRAVRWRQPGRSYLELSRGDDGEHLIVLDASWTRDIWSAVSDFRRRGGHVTVVIYDLIPLTHPQFCEPGHVAVFRDWVRQAFQNADVIVGISRFVMDEVGRMMYAQALPAPPQLDYFYLGADLQAEQVAELAERHDLKCVFNVRPSYIMVSTLEPRKNHTTVLDAFELLWEAGLEVNLILIGRSGWKNENFLSRMRSHNEWNKRLLHYDDVSDSELLWCYKNARALVFASFIEGFGLPLIEAMENNLPVIASDIPVHREVAGDAAYYFEVDDAESLYHLIRDVEQGDKQLLVDRLCFRKMSWLQSSHMLLAASGIAR